jgi:purine-binding chemotaxis protein CheW
MSNLVTTGKSAVAKAMAEENQQYLTFMLGGEVFAIGILSIKEIIEYGHLTSVPLMPAHIRGVINLRGAVVPVIDLSARFGRDGTQVTRRTCIVILEVIAGQDKQDIGVVVDAVNEVVEIPDSQIEPSPAFGANIRTDFIQGMGKVNERFVIILSVDHVLSVEELAALGQFQTSLQNSAA